VQHDALIHRTVEFTQLREVTFQWARPSYHNFGAIRGSVGLLLKPASTLVTRHDTNIPTVASANKLNQFGSSKFSVKYHPTTHIAGPAINGVNSE